MINELIQFLLSRHMLTQKEGQFPEYQEKDFIAQETGLSRNLSIFVQCQKCETVSGSHILLSKNMQILDRHLHVINIRNVKNHSLSTVSSYNEKKSSIF